jgi:HlyD family secretion protein
MFRKACSLILVGIMLASLTSCSLKTKDNTNKYTATIEAEGFYIPAEVSGKITSILIEQGSEIKADQIVAEIESTGLELQKKQAEAALRIAELKKEDLPGKASSKAEEQAEEAIKQAQAAVDILQFQIQKTKPTASIEGIVSEVFLHKGEMASPGVNIAKAINLKNRYIKIYVEEEKRNLVKLNNSIPLYYNGKASGEGKIIYVSPESEFTPKNVEKKSDKEKTVFEVKIKLEEGTSLLPGTMVDVEIKE